jgi:hypothetical protein
MGKKFTVKCNSCGREIESQKIHIEWTPKEGLMTRVSTECKCGNTETREYVKGLRVTNRTPERSVEDVD